MWQQREAGGAPGDDHHRRATSHRWIMWREPGTWRDPGAPQWTDGPPYFLRTDGLTDAAFWAIASSLTPIR